MIVTLVGSGSADKQSVEVTNCFCVPHKEYEERVEADLQYAQDMLELNKKVTTQVDFCTNSFCFSCWNKQTDVWSKLIDLDNLTLKK